MKRFNIYFKGYRRDIKKSTLPDYSGIYFVYRATYNEANKTVSLKELIYIGQAKDLNQRLNNHEKYDDFLAQLKEGEIICYSYAAVDMQDLDIVEKALVYVQQPPLNTDLTKSYNHDAASFLIEGHCALLKHNEFSFE